MGQAPVSVVVPTLVSRERNFARAALMGVWWGLGHTLALVLAGAVLVGLRAEMPFHDHRPQRRRQVIREFGGVSVR